jgi:hypothetical protein
LCYELYPDLIAPDAESVGPLPRFIILDSGSHQGYPETDSVIRFYATGLKRSPTWRQRGDSLFIFLPRTARAQVNLRLLVEGSGLMGVATYTTDVEGKAEVAVTGRRADGYVQCDM